MTLHVQRQVVAARESSLAQLALERSDARVFTIMTCELITSGKLPATTFPSTVVRLLARMRSHVRF